MKNIFFFDVEATSLHGFGFAVGAIVCDALGNEIDRFERLSTRGAETANESVKENVLPNLSGMPSVAFNRMLRDEFLKFYLQHKDTCEIWSDVNFPVETNFLSAIVADDPDGRQWMMPYPLFDLASLLHTDVDRNEYSGLSGLRKHHPLDDARASLACLLKIRSEMFK